MRKGIGLSLALAMWAGNLLAAEDVPQSIALEGIHVSGTPDVAKVDGFTKCKNEYSYYRCAASKTISIFGIPAKNGYIDLKPNGAYREVSEAPAEKLWYSAVNLSIEQYVVDEKCVKKVRAKSKEKNIWAEAIPPDECIVPGGIPALKEKLEAAGWLSEPIKHGARYFNADLPICIDINSSSHPPLDNVFLVSISENDAKSGWKRVSEKTVQKKESAKKTDDFIKSMEE
jgi:hypothetical protein